MPIEVCVYLIQKDKLEKDERKLFKQYIRFLDEEMKLSVDADELIRKKK
jgi:hypothetical protein